MLRVIACITQEHNPWLFGLAALLCAITSISAFLMLSRAGARSVMLGRVWATAAGVTAGLRPGPALRLAHPFAAGSNWRILDRP
jgi:hypothetical protein